MATKQEELDNIQKAEDAVAHMLVLVNLQTALIEQRRQGVLRFDMTMQQIVEALADKVKQLEGEVEERFEQSMGTNWKQRYETKGEQP